MHSFRPDDNDFGASPNASSDDEQNEQMDELEEVEGDGEGEEEEEEEEELENGVDEDVVEDDHTYAHGPNSQAYYSDSLGRRAEKQPIRQSASLAASNNLSQDVNHLVDDSSSVPGFQPRPTVLLTLPSPEGNSAAPTAISRSHPRVRAEALTAPVYDIVPTIAAPHSTSINAIAATPDLRWVFSGGADGYIRKFNWVETANSKVMLTVAQRHPFVDSVTKAGVLTSYWENEEPQTKPGDDGQTLSSVYSLAVQNQGLWLLSGLESGGINLQSVRHDEGKRITCLRKHTSAVSVLTLAEDEQSVLSGSWDKRVLDWDLNTGQVKRSFEGSGGQISALEMRPLSDLPVPETVPDQALSNGTFSTNTSTRPRVNGSLANGMPHDAHSDAQENGNAAALGSPTDSLFGGNDADSLFGDNDEDNTGAPSGGNFAEDDDDEFSRAIANGIQQQENEDAADDANMMVTTTATDVHEFDGFAESTGDQVLVNGLDHFPSIFAEAEPVPLANGLPHGDELKLTDVKAEPLAIAPETTPTADSTFLAASHDGTLRVWDRRKAAPVAKISPRNVPPWCMGACWSPDGNFIYAGRRNGTVEEFSLRHGLRGVERTFKFPNGSGAVSAVRAMPNGRHLICASYDILRLYDLHQQQTFKHSTVPFLIVPGHRTGVVSQLYIDPTYIEVTVTVDGISKTDRKIRQSLTEWGNCSTRGQSRISTYIEAQTGKQFTIRIQANIPAISKAAAVDDDELEADVGHDLSASMITMNSTTLRGRGIGEENTWRQGMTSQA